MRNFRVRLKSSSVIPRSIRSFSARRAAKVSAVPIINAGDGAHEHPTQALLDMLTIIEHKGGIEGLTVAIVGDIAHSRVARSNIWGLMKLGATVRIVGPETLLPAEIRQLPVEVHTDLRSGIRGCDVVNVLRIQLERQEAGLFPSLREYAQRFGVNSNVLREAQPDVLVMHPGPMNRGVEIAPDVADGEFSVVTEQVTNGVAVRMALLYLLLGGSPDAASN